MAQNVITAAPRLSTVFQPHDARIAQALTRGSTDGIPIGEALSGETSIHELRATLNGPLAPGLGANVDLLA